MSMVRRFSYRADDPGEAVILARFIDLTIRETRRRALL